MSKVPVYWLSLHEDALHRGQWDDTVCTDLFDGKFGKVGYEFEHHEVREIPKGDGGLVIIHARLHDKDIKEVNRQLSFLDWAIVFLVGDEQNLFPYESLKHRNFKTWTMHPRPGRHKGRFLVNGYAPDTKLLKDCRAQFTEKPLDFFFSGQMGHARRDECVAAINQMPNGKVVSTKGFTQGLDHQQYFQLLASAKFAPCPSGPQMPDTFRLYEALEAGCVPIVDQGPDGYPGGFWENLFGEVPPFPVVDDWGSAKGVIEELLPDWKAKSNEIGAWWQRMKRKIALNLQSDIFALSATDPQVEDITIMMPTSPIPRHPSTEVITETIASIRERLPKSEILVQIDGVRDEQKDRRADYEEYTRSLLWECKWKHQNVVPIVFDSHHHQSLMAKATIDEVKTPYLLYCESDTPLTDSIDFRAVLEGLKKFNLVRFSHEAVIPKPHEEMMLDKEPVDGFIRTVQWSSRPHIARTEYYRWLLAEYFEWGKRAFTEHVLFGKIIEEYDLNGFYGWQKFGMALYAPDPANLRRSANLDGRGKDKVYESEV